MAWNLVYFLVIGVLVNSCLGHGQMDEPPSRASAWRFGIDTPVNYNDNELFCGGLHRLWGINNGKCGICGDPWDSPEPRNYETGGSMTTGDIVRTYKANDVITIKIRLTAAHKGYWEIRLCTDPLNSTEDCFQHILELTTGGTKFYPEGSRTYSLTYKLPLNVSCDHCVISWWYKAGNNWGVCADGTGALGCGEQEYFRGCADVTILPGFFDMIAETAAGFPGGENALVPEESSEVSHKNQVVYSQHLHEEKSEESDEASLISLNSTKTISTEQFQHTSTTKSIYKLQPPYLLSVLNGAGHNSEVVPSMPVVQAFGAISSLAGALQKGSEALVSPKKPFILHLYLLVNDTTI